MVREENLLKQGWSLDLCRDLNILLANFATVFISLFSGCQDEDDRGKIRPTPQGQEVGGGGGGRQGQGSAEDQVLLRCHEDETGQVSVYKLICHDVMTSSLILALVIQYFSS